MIYIVILNIYDYVWVIAANYIDISIERKEKAYRIKMNVLEPYPYTILWFLSLSLENGKIALRF